MMLCNVLYMKSRVTRVTVASELIWRRSENAVNMRLLETQIRENVVIAMPTFEKAWSRTNMDSKLEKRENVTY